MCVIWAPLSHWLPANTRYRQSKLYEIKCMPLQNGKVLFEWSNITKKQTPRGLANDPFPAPNLPLHNKYISSTYLIGISLCVRENL